MITEAMPDALDGERIDRVVAIVTGLSRNEAAALLAGGAVSLDGRSVTKPSARVAAGQVVAVDAELGAVPTGPRGDASVPVELVHVDDDVLVVDKQPGLVVHPGAGNDAGTLVHGLLARYPEMAGVGEPARPGIVHRLDKGTSGLLVVARTPAAYESLVEQLAGRSATRRYLALVWGHLASSQGMVDAPIGRSQREPTRMAVSARGREARTRYEVLAAHDEPAATAMVRCRLDTGRTHQIRVHLAAIGHPVVGDERYGGRRPPLLDVPRPFLHAEHLAFRHPVTGAELAFDSPLPDDLAAIRDRLA